MAPSRQPDGTPDIGARPASATAAEHNRPALRRWTMPVGWLHCNCSVVADTTARQAVVVDPGDNVGQIVALLDREHLHLAAIAITHAHIDHIGGAAALQAQRPAPVYLQPADTAVYATLEDQAAWLGVPPPPRAAIDAPLREGAPLAFGGFRFEVIETPGHTPGSCCLYLPSESLLLAGDTLFAGSVGRTDLPGGDSRRLMRSIQEKLLPLPDSTCVVPGHGVETTIGAERRSNPFLL
ncbi:MAG: MBL fold metallo-hydrolase [Terriglobales bacterium]